MTRYIYSGPATGIEINGEERMVHPGDPIELPSDHPIAVGWLAHRYLTEAPAKAKAAKPATEA